VRRVLDGKGVVADCTTSVGEAYKLFMASHIDKSADYKKTLKSRVGRWVEEFGSDRMLSDITAQEVTMALRKRLVDDKDQKTWTTYNKHLGDIKTFVGWCAKPERKFIESSPLEGVSGLAIAYKEPEYVKAGDVEKLFRTLERHKDDAPSDLADAVLSFFCGMRQSEILRVRDGDGSVKIDIAEGFVRVVKVKGATHGTRPRAFKLSEQALAWMRSFDFMSAVAEKNAKFRVHLTKRAKEAGIILPKNAGRHTFITMHAAAYHDQNQLTSIVGNTEGVRASSYDGIEVEKNGKAYFAIMPQNAPTAA
jgi:integrase